jgi:uracil-DNA glycosylase family 4
MQCRDCELHRYARRPVPGDGPVPADLMIIGEAPGAEEDRLGRPFAGAAGKMLNEILKKYGSDRKDVYVTNVCKCRPTDNRDPKNEEYRACLPKLQQEVKDVQPKVILTLGRIALQALTGKSKITKARGVATRSELLDMDVLPTFHPAAVLHGNANYLSYIERDVQKAVEWTRKGRKSMVCTSYHLATTWKEVDEIVQHAQYVKRFSYDIESMSLDPRIPSARVLLLGIGFDPGDACVIPIGHPDSPFKRWKGTMVGKLQRLFNSPAIKIAHNAKFDIQYLEETLRLNIADPIYCSMLAHYLIDETRGTHALKTLVWDYTDMGGYDEPLRDWFEEHGMVSKSSRDYSRVPLDVLYPYCAADCDATLRIYEKFDDAHTPAQRKLMTEFFAPALRVVIAMERHGMFFDLEYNAKLEEVLPARAAEFVDRMRKLYRPEVEEVEQRMSQREFKKRFDKLKSDRGKANAQPKRVIFNWGSDDQIRELLFDTMRLPHDPEHKTDAGNISTDEDALLYILERQDCPLVEDLLDWRKLDTLHSTFVRGLREKVGLDGRIHGEYNLQGTETGRLSSNNPNMQNIPRTPLIKNQFIAPPGWVIVQADFSQIELRVAAMLSGDATMIQLFLAGGDMHLETASRVYAKPKEEITKEQRTLAKRTGFGILYQRGAKAISVETGVPESEAKQFIKDYYILYPGIANWVDAQKRQVRKTGQVTTPFGRIRRLPGAFSDDKATRAEAERQAVNTPVQSTASDLTVRSMIILHKRFDPAKARLVGNIHDAVKIYARVECTESVCQLCKQVMENIPGLPKILTTVPITVDIEYGQRWGDLRGWGK